MSFSSKLISYWQSMNIQTVTCRGPYSVKPWYVLPVGLQNDSAPTTLLPLLDKFEMSDQACNSKSLLCKLFFLKTPKHGTDCNHERQKTRLTHCDCISVVSFTIFTTWDHFLLLFLAHYTDHSKLRMWTVKEHMKASLPSQMTRLSILAMKGCLLSAFPS